MNIQLLAFFFIFDCFLCCVLVDADIVLAFEIVWKTVFIFSHIESEMLAGFQIVEISVRVSLLFCYIVKKPFKVFAFEQFFNGSKTAVVDKPEFRLFI